MSDLERVAPNEIAKKEKWNLQAVWHREQAAIEKFVQNQANLAYGKHQREPELAKKFADDTWRQISERFPYDDHIEPALLDAAKQGRIQSSAGSATMINVFGVLR